MRVYIIDDELLARQELRYILEQYEGIDVIGDDENIKKLLLEDSFSSIDCLFLDIELQNSNGMDIAKQLITRPDCPLIIFSTAYDHYALQAFEVNAFDYILKPFDDERIRLTIAKLKQHFENQTALEKEPFDLIEKIAVNADERIALVKLDDILYFTSEESKTIAVTNKKKYTVADSLVTLEKKLCRQQFMRIHRAYLINTDHLQELEPWGTSKYNVILNENVSIAVSRMYVKEVRKLFHL